MVFLGLTCILNWYIELSSNNYVRMRKKSINLLKSRSDFSYVFNETEECSHPLVHVGLENPPPYQNLKMLDLLIIREMQEKL